MAHAICAAEIQKRGWPVCVYSAGMLDLTGQAPTIATWITCCQNGTPPQGSGATFVQTLPLPLIDRFFVMEHEHSMALINEYHLKPARVSLLGAFDPMGGVPEVEDPMHRGAVETERCYTRIRRCILHYLDSTTEIPGTPKQVG